MTNFPLQPASLLESDKFLGMMKFVRLSKAAEMLGCTKDQLLHFGALGLLEVFAPVLAAGEFAWPTGQGSSAFIDLDQPFERYFDASCRVGIFPQDLARIEAVGWVVPWRFYAPDYARDVMQHAPRTFEESLAEKNKARLDKISQTKANALTELKREGLDEARADYLRYIINAQVGDAEFEKMLNKGALQFRENGFRSAWVRVDSQDEPVEQTTIDHLFVTPDELVRLQEGLPQTPIFSAVELAGVPARPEHGNTASNARKRFETLLAAVWLYRKEIRELVKDARAWTHDLEVRAPELWKSGVPPFETRGVEDLLRSVLSDKGIEKWLQRKSENTE
ncbi:hypothetical protein SAMN05216319_3649 [Duganella sp. CF402]|uniref:hypothetical protein n=1 Tax=unclassified Duganella TaxID=2636909 RepID=UPI0008C475EF|nr:MULTISPECIES: hypothetical protein [unclassified Duganella]RZT04565.1 hypothetical protein EV582_5456 [Duganella sp. BK701]SEM31961.1 hypothetical protein SAMN05216319_3649 [Duganella sp. CF402]